MKFQEQESGLYIFKPNIKAPINIYPHCKLVTTIEENKNMFTKRQVCNADLARELYRIIGRPGEDVFEDILRTKKNIIVQSLWMTLATLLQFMDLTSPN